MDPTLVISVLAITVSATTAWFTLFHKGAVRMTQPNFMAIIPRDGLSAKCPKFFLRALLFCTSKSGRAVESMFIKIVRDGDVRKFQYWAYGERDMLVPGSGMFVGPGGHEANHHFTPIENDATYDFKPGKYIVEVFGKVVGSKRPTLLKSLSFILSDQEALALKDADDTAIFFWRDVESASYLSKIDKRRGRGRAHSVSGSGGGSFSWEDS
jgi:hypothetical protein